MLTFIYPSIFFVCLLCFEHQLEKNKANKSDDNHDDYDNNLKEKEL